MSTATLEKSVMQLENATVRFCGDSGDGMQLAGGQFTNTSALVEPYITLDSTTRPSRWIDWNQFNDELSYAQAFRNAAVSAGFQSNIGMLIDTSRNGWGGAARPTGPSTLSDLNARIDASRIDRRIHKGNWCNPAGAGIGERPRAAPNSAARRAAGWTRGGSRPTPCRSTCGR